MSDAINNIGNDAPEVEGTEEGTEKSSNALSVDAPDGTHGDFYDSEEGDDSEETPKEVEKQIKELKRKFKLKVDGEEFEEEVDLDDDEYITKQLQLAKAAQRRMQESATLKKEVTSFIELLQNDPVEALSKMGIDVDNLAESHIERKIQEMQKSPDQLAQERAQKELEALKKQLQSKEDEARNSEMSRMQQEYELEIDKDITSALESSSDLPKSPYVVKRVADMMMLAIKNGHENVKANDVLPIVQKQMKAELQQMFDAMPEDVMEAVIGKGNTDRMRKKRIQAAKKSKLENASKIKDSGESTRRKAEATSESKEKVSYRDFFKNI